MENIEVVTTVTFIFFIYLVLAIFVERTLEILMAIYNYVEFKFNWHAFWNRKARAYQERFHRLYNFQGEGTNNVQKLFNWIKWKVISDKPYEGGKEVISAALIRLNYRRIGSRVVAFLISLSLVLSLGLDLIAIIENLLPDVNIVRTALEYKIVRVVLTSAAISVGSEPLHEIISRIERMERRKKATTQGGTNGIS